MDPEEQFCPHNQLISFCSECDPDLHGLINEGAPFFPQGGLQPGVPGSSQTVEIPRLLHVLEGPSLSQSGETLESTRSKVTAQLKQTVEATSSPKDAKTFSSPLALPSQSVPTPELQISTEATAGTSSRSKANFSYLFRKDDQVSLCRVCYKTFDNRDKLKTHEHKYHCQGTYSCPLCNKRFVRERSFKTHVVKHSGYVPLDPEEQLHDCLICGNEFALVRHLDNHMKCHEGFDPIVCEVCGDSFVYYSNFNRHMKRHKLAKCEVCGKMFASASGLENHMRRYHLAKHNCPHCGKRISNKHNLTEHIKIHTRLKQCPVCGEILKGTKVFRNHMKEHK